MRPLLRGERAGKITSKTKIFFVLAPGLGISRREQGEETLAKMQLFFCFLLIHAGFFHNADDIRI